MRGPDVQRGELGQAALELVGSIPLLVAVGVVVLQLLAVGYAQSLADGAAEAGAIALSSGLPAGPAVRSALPGWASRRIDVEVDGGAVDVSLEPLSILPRAGSALQVGSSAWARRPADP